MGALMVRPTVGMKVTPPEQRPKERDTPIRRVVVDDTDILQKEEEEFESARPKPAAGGQGEKAEAVVAVAGVGQKEYPQTITPGSRCKVRQKL